MDIDFIEQLVDSLQESVSVLEEAKMKKDKAKLNQMKVFTFDLHKELTKELGGNA